MKPRSPWVTQTLARLSLDEKLGQMLHPNVRANWTSEDLKNALPDVAMGGIFIFSGSASDYVRLTNLIQDGRGLPVLISTDLESGAGRMISGATSFPDLMNTAAANDSDLAELMGEATAIEARAYGVHWTFGPVVDVNMNPGNPICNTRSLGDDPQRIACLASAMLKAMQRHGLAATVKHFPGDGWDDRDQHLVTSINPLSREEWEHSSGIPFRRAFADGCWTTMIGHIAMPQLDPGDPTDPAGPPPAILSRKIATDFLRGGLGFEGLVVSDAIEMNGSVSRVRTPYELIVKLVNAGNDQLLFCQARRDFAILKEAVAKGDITIERVDEAVSRVLALKEQLGFASDPESARPAKDPEAVLAPHRQRFATASRLLAEKSLTQVRSNGQVPLRLKAGSRVLVVHLRSNPEYNVDGFDDLLRARGIDLERFTEETSPFQCRSMDFSRYDAILVLWVLGPTWGTGFIRPSGPWMRLPWFIRHEYPQCPMVHISFGTPYLIHDVPWADTLLNAYSPDPATQAAVDRWLFGDIRAEGSSPVDLDRPAKIRELMRGAFSPTQ